MSRRGNWDRLRMRQRIWRNGTTDCHGDLDAMREAERWLRRPPRVRKKRPKVTNIDQQVPLANTAAAAFMAWRERRGQP